MFRSTIIKRNIHLIYICTSVHVMFFYTFCIIPHHNVEFTKLGIKRVNQHSKPIHLKYNIYGRSRGVTTPPPPLIFLKNVFIKIVISHSELTSFRFTWSECPKKVMWRNMLRFFFKIKISRWRSMNPQLCAHIPSSRATDLQLDIIK